MVDNHIDRSGVKALWGVELTDTNNLIDFIHLKILSSNSMRICDLKKRALFKKTSKEHKWSGDYSFLEPPDPIPNSDVKQKHANGSSA